MAVKVKQAGSLVRSLSFLTYDEALVPAGGKEVICSTAGLVKQTRIDAAGHSFHDVALKQAGCYEYPEDASDKDSDAEPVDRPASPTESAQDDQPPPGTNWKSTGKKKKAKRSKEEDLYGLLGLGNERWTATDKQIKDAYRKTALEYHPDKCGAATADEETRALIEEKFKLIQEAYETLSDPVRRREFDSTDEFDDTLPVECAPEDFFKVFAPAFRRNTRWSVHTPVPEVGDENTPDDVVEKFYDFWFGFKSWREFPHPDEEDLEQAESREHKRWIDRINRKLRDIGKKEETKRLKEFVENAYRTDPRVARRKEKEKAERLRRKQEKAAAAQQKRDEEVRKATEQAARVAAEQARAAEEAAEARKLRQKEKKAMQKERSRLRSLAGGIEHVEDWTIEQLCANCSLEELQELCEHLATDGISHEAQQLHIEDAARQMEVAAGAKKKEKEQTVAATAAETAAAKRQEEAERKARLNSWQDEEVRMLEKAVAKYPQGTAKRWEAVAGYVRTRTVAEVLEMIKFGLKAGKFAPRQESFAIAKKRQANTAINSEASRRDEAFSDVDVNLSGAAAKVLASNGTATPAAKPTATPTKAAPSPSPPVKKISPFDAVAASEALRKPSQRAAAAVPPATPTAKPKKAKPAKPAAADSAGTAGAAQAAGENGSAAQTENGGAAAPADGQKKAGESGWSEEQELALVKAMKQFGKDVEDRWERVAEVVSGKNKAQCFRRFKQLRETFRAKQAA
ncbi:hypothetical protein WJX72_012515 [[Myrmecia] bisecta]|uniref:Uncharacterized protein n=1 Tax=[Myrmecia] bisecta TaxID=41462 RepID=A0AAW1QC39_9CHLO